MPKNCGNYNLPFYSRRKFRNNFIDRTQIGGQIKTRIEEKFLK